MNQVETRTVLPGWSELDFRPIVFGLAAAFCAGFVTVLALFAAAGSSGREPYWSTALVLVWIVCGVALVGIWIGKRGLARAAEELAEGYTTVWIGGQDVDLVDSRTGAILRRAGEPLIDRRTFRERRRQARAALAEQTALPDSEGPTP